MKLLTDTDIQETSGPILGTLQLGIDEANFGLATQVLMDIYESPIDSIVRELASNALDAHTQAGKAHIPVEVTLPTQLSPNLVVRDRGVGMSREFLATTYTRLLSSTKRGANDEIGGYGIGGKAPLGYTDTYTLSTRQAGTELHVSASRSGGFVLLGSNRTTEDDGTTVTVPVHTNDCKAFAEAVSWLRYMEPSPLINGHPIVPEKVLLQGDNWFIADAGTPYRSNMQILLGPIPYTLDTSKLGDFGAVNGIIRTVANAKYMRVRFPIGSLTVTPSRETLRYDENTITTIKQVLHSVFKPVIAAMDAMLARCEWKLDAGRLCWKYSLSDWYHAADRHSDYNQYSDADMLPGGESWFQFTLNGNGSKRESIKHYPTRQKVEAFLHDHPPRSRMRMEAYMQATGVSIITGPLDSAIPRMKLFPTRLLSELPDVLGDDDDEEESTTKPRKVLDRLPPGTMRARLWQCNGNPDGRLLYAHTVDTTMPLDGEGLYIVMNAGNVVHPHLTEHRKLEYLHIEHMRTVMGIESLPLYVVNSQGVQRLGTGWKDILTTTHEHLKQWLPWIKHLYGVETVPRTFYGYSEKDWVRFGVGGYLLEYLKLAREAEDLLKGKPYGTYGAATGILPGVLDLYQYYLPTLWNEVPALPTNPVNKLYYLVDKLYPLTSYISASSRDMKQYLQMMETLQGGADGWYSSCKLTGDRPTPTMSGRELMIHYYGAHADVAGYYERYGQ